MTTAEENPSRPRDVAIIGMACVMPGAPDVEAFWSNIVDGVDSVTEVPESRWNVDIHFDPDFEGAAKTESGKEHKSVSKWGGFVPDVGFDALKWGIPPASLAAIDPAQLMALKTAGAALDDAGYGEGGRTFDRDRASTVWATGSGGAIDLSAGHLLRLLLASHGVTEIPEELDDFLPEMTEDGLPGVLTSVIAGRVANRLDLGGKNTTVDSACASVLVALDIACSYLAASTASSRASAARPTGATSASPPPGRRVRSRPCAGPTPTPACPPPTSASSRPTAPARWRATAPSC
jgi:acyl transferase domain-containing protein